MIIRRAPVRPSFFKCQLSTPSASNVSSAATSRIPKTARVPRLQQRCLHARIAAPPTPSPTPFVPDVKTFLTLIGRGLAQHTDKIGTWDKLFTMSSSELRDAGIDPPRSRKYLLRWRDKFRHGEFGVGGDARFVDETGAAECRVVEIPAPASAGSDTGGLTRTPGIVTRVLNIAATRPQQGEEEQTEKLSEGEDQGSESTTPPTMPAATRSRPIKPAELREAKPITGVRLKPGHGIHGTGVRLVKGAGGSVGVLSPQEGLWEHRRRNKVDGGERRKAEVRFKRRAADRRAGRA